MGCTSSTTDANKVSNIKPQQQQNHLSTAADTDDDSRIKINGDSYHVNGELSDDYNEDNEIENQIENDDNEGNGNDDETRVGKKETSDNNSRKRGDPFAEEAAIKIQSGYRGYRVRKELRNNNNNTPSNMKEDESTIDPKEQDVNKAATTIQAGFKGYKVRKEYKKQKSENSSSDEGSPKKSAAISDEIDQIDLNDPEVEKAATKIQATFRGYKTRKETGPTS